MKELLQCLAYNACIKKSLFLCEIQVTSSWAAEETERKLIAFPEQILSVWELPLTAYVEKLIQTQQFFFVNTKPYKETHIALQNVLQVSVILHLTIYVLMNVIYKVKLKYQAMFDLKAMFVDVHSSSKGFQIICA